MSYPNTHAVFIRGVITAEFISTRRGPIKPSDLRDYLADRGEYVSLRTCQRYLLAAEAVVPVERVA